MIHTFRVSLPFEAFYEGELKIEAENYQNALDILKRLSNDEIDDRTENWEINFSNTITNTNDLQVYDQKGNILN